jgi:hypothetical protein
MPNKFVILNVNMFNALFKLKISVRNTEWWVKLGSYFVIGELYTWASSWDLFCVAFKSPPPHDYIDVLCSFPSALRWGRERICGVWVVIYHCEEQQSSSSVDVGSLLLLFLHVRRGYYVPRRYYLVTGALSRGLTLTTHPHLVPRSRMSRSYTSSPQAPSWRVVGQL